MRCYHSTNSTPSVSPFGLPAPPSGSRGIVRIRPGFHEAITAYRETPLRLAKSRLTAVARLHGACGRTSQAQGACQLSFALSSCTPPFGRLHLLNLSGELWRKDLPCKGRRAAHQRGGGVCGTQNTIQKIQGESVEASLAPRWGSWQPVRADLAMRRRHASEQPPSGGS